MADVYVCRQHGLSEPCDLCGTNRTDAEQCECEHLFADHQKPPIGTPWDICSFPCVECDCQEFVANAEDEAEAVLRAYGTSGKEVVNEFIERLLKENLELKQELARRAAVTAPRGDVAQRRLEIALGYIKRAANRELPKLPCRVDEMTEREVAIFNVGAAAVGNLQFIARELDALPAAATSSPAPAESVCAKCGGSGEIEIGCAMDHALTAPCVECRGTGTVTAAPSERTRVEGEREIQKLRQAIGWICDAADAAYIEDSDNTRIHEIFNIAAQAAGLTRRLPDEHGRFDETIID